jgi:tetratricopeptide (TPR) repeat protein
MAEILGDKEGLDKLAELIYRRSDGNAFFIQEMLHALVERGDIYREDDRWEGGTISEMEVPKSIRSVIGQRLSRLEEGSQEILREASVLGQEFSFDDLLALKSFAPSVRAAAPPAGPSMEDSVEGALEQAILAGLVREIGGESYAFNHALTQQTLYGELSPRRRKRLHLAAGQALERLPERERERRAAEMAWHFLEGDDPEQALRWAVLAGTQAEQVFANREAERQYRTALELARELGNVPCEVEALELLAGVLIIGARYNRALDTLEEAARLYRETGDREGEARVVAQMGRIHFMEGTTEEGITRLQPLVEALEAQGAAPVGRASLWAALAELYSDAGEYEKQLKAAERALELVATVDLGTDGERPGKISQSRAAFQRLVLGAEVTRGDALWRLGERDAALQVMEELIPRAEAAADLDTLARALGNAATYYAGRGELEKDRSYLERSLSVAERRGDRGQMILSLMALSTNAFQLGRWAQADAELTRAEQIVRSLENTRLAIWPMASRAWLSLRRGDLDEAEKQAQHALSLLGAVGDAPWRRNLLRILAERAILSGRPEEAVELLEQGEEESAWKRDSGFLQTLAWAELARNQPQEARSTADRAVTRARIRNRNPDLVPALTVYAAAVDAAGDAAEADRALDEATTLAHAIPLPFEEARALYEWGRLLVRRGERERGRQRLSEALAIFERLGAAIDAQRAQDELARQ